MLLVAIDPGPLTSAYVVMSGPREFVDSAIVDNEAMRDVLLTERYDRCVIEYTPPYTMQMVSGDKFVSRQVVDTAIEIGRLWQCVELHGRDVELFSRMEVKKHLLGRTTGGDPDVRAALLDCWGCGSTREARGTVKSPGPLRAITNDLWAALGVGVAYWEQKLARR